MDLLYDDNVEAFALVTSDSDFTSLAHRLRESGKTVYVLGENKAPDALKYACDKFIDLEVVQSEEQSARRRPRRPTRADDPARDDADVAPGADDQPAERADPGPQRRLGRRRLGQPRRARQPAQPDPPLLRRAHLRRQQRPGSAPSWPTSPTWRPPARATRCACGARARRRPGRRPRRRTKAPEGRPRPAKAPAKTTTRTPPSGRQARAKASPDEGRPPTPKQDEAAEVTEAAASRGSRRRRAPRRRRRREASRPDPQRLTHHSCVTAGTAGRERPGVGLP